MNINIPDIKSITESIAESEAVDFNKDIDLIATLFATEVDKSKIKKKKD